MVDFGKALQRTRNQKAIALWESFGEYPNESGYFWVPSIDFDGNQCRSLAYYRGSLISKLTGNQDSSVPVHQVHEIPYKPYEKSVV